MIHARQLERRFGEKRVISSLDLDVAEGRFLVVTGPNGSGKSTFLALCARLLAPTRGILEIAAERREIGYLGHEPLVYRELSPLENLDLYGRLYRVSERRERTGMLLERFGLWRARHERVAALSRGMAQRLALCRVFLHEPRLLLLDEPHAGLDAASRALLDEEIAALAGARTLVVATHEPKRLAPFTTEAIALA
ncbi:MAG: ABC transporter ATP-binding protein [Actinomycetota bacterium]|nr:ABC transporter ATP-binding protein [Actinomycetota bacterium]